MDFRIQDETSAIKRDKPPIYYFGISCVALGFQIHTVTVAFYGLEVPTLPEQDNLVKGFYLTGFCLGLFSFLMVTVSLFRNTVNPRSALTLALIGTILGVFCTGTSIAVYAKHTIDLKYKPGEFPIPYPFTAYVSATAVSLVGAMSVLINLCTE